MKNFTAEERAAYDAYVVALLQGKTIRDMEATGAISSVSGIAYALLSQRRDNVGTSSAKEAPDGK